MKRIYEFITKANQVLLFLALTVGLGLALAIPAFQNVRSLRPRQVAVADPGASPVDTAVRDVRFLGKWGDYFVFGIMKRAISAETDGLAHKASRMELFRSYGSDSDTGQMVNVVYSRGDRVVKSLLAHDGLILDPRLPRSTNREVFAAHLYLCVTADTNGDHTLDEKDRPALVIVDPDLKRPDVIIADCVQFEILTFTRLMVKTQTDGALRFFEVDVQTGEKTEAVWK